MPCSFERDVISIRICNTSSSELPPLSTLGVPEHSQRTGFRHRDELGLAQTEQCLPTTVPEQVEQIEQVVGMTIQFCAVYY